jgi:hypothetical protein
MERPALPPRRASRAPRLLLVAVPAVAAVTLAVALLVWRSNDAGDGTIIDYGPADPPATALDPHIVASITSGGGMTDGQPGQGLAFELYDDGSVFTTGTGTYGLDRYRLTEAGTARARELLAGVDLDDTAYGEPTISDMPSTTVYVNLDGEPADVRVYALTDLPGDLGDLGLGVDEQAVRAELQAIVADLTGLATGTGDLLAEPPASYTPDRLDVAFIPWVSDDEVTGEISAEPLPWPLDTPLTERTLGWEGLRLCATVEGDEVGAVTDAMAVERPGPQDHAWMTGAGEGERQPTVVAVQLWGLRPGQQSCADRPASAVPHDPIQLDAGPLYSIDLVDPEAAGEAGWDGELPADSFRRAEPLEVDAVVPALAVAAATDPATSLSSSDLTWYDYRAVVAEVDGTEYLDIEARPTAGSVPGPGEPNAWRARVDLTTTEVTTVEAG